MSSTAAAAAAGGAAASSGRSESQPWLWLSRRGSAAVGPGATRRAPERSSAADTAYYDVVRRLAGIGPG